MTQNLQLTGRSRLGVLILASFLVLSAAQPILRVQATSNTAFTFSLIGPNTALAGATIPGTPIVAGDIIQFTGSGSFDSSSNTAIGGGSFTHSRPDGTIIARGTWVITAFQSFTAYGGPNLGKQGGLLHVTVTIIGPEANFSSLTLQVSCQLNAPTGAPEEGTTLLGLFSTPTGGNTLFHQA